jgi:ABC-type transport system involved in multi-copper enzyme maturation permease subunit
MILSQTKAIFIDAYRELNAKKMFWITMALNLLAVVLFASLGINERGVTFLHWTIDSSFFNEGNISRELFYKIQFTTWGIPFWLSWITAILALISTASIVPDLVSSGIIEPVLSKPIGRVRLFLTKYLTGLLFVGFQVLVFSVGCLLVIGIRGGAWEPELLLAVPIVLMFFSYLFAVCAFFGLVTRSTIAALLLTLLFWFAVWLVNTGDNMILAQREGSIVQLEDRRADVEKQERFAENRMQQLRDEGKAVPGDTDRPLPDGIEDPMVVLNPALTTSRNRLEEAEQSVETWRGWYGRVFALKTILPKTQETIGLTERWLITQEEINALLGLSTEANRDRPENEDAPAFADPRASERVTRIMRERSIGWVLGTSFAFEFVVLGICCLIFVRRDF